MTTNDLVLDSVYQCQRPVEVERFLQAHPELLGIMLAAIPHLKRIFGSRIQVVLEVVPGYVAVEDETLFGYIQTRVGPKDALEQLDRIDEEWLLDQRVDDLLCFTL